MSGAGPGREVAPEHESRRVGPEPLRAEHVVRFAYDRSVGGAVERFLTGLAEGQVLGSRISDGRVLVPPVDIDPATGGPAGEYVPVGAEGTVRSWTWVAEPAADHPLPQPFAFVLVQLDGADATLLHVLDVPAEEDVRTGLRVRADWRHERTGSIRDIRAFVPLTPDRPPTPADSAADSAGAAAGAAESVGPADVTVHSDLELRYTYEPGQVLSGFLRGLAERRIEGGRCPSCGAVYVPPRPRCPTCHAGPLVPQPVDERGVVVSYTVVHIPPYGSRVEVPFAWAWIQLDGTAAPFPHLLGDLAPDAIEVGLPVRAVWQDDAELAPTWASIRHFGPAS